MVYLLKYDTVYGRYEPQVEAVGKLVIDGTPLAYLSERDPERLPWADLGVDLVLECIGRFTDRADAGKRWSRSRSSSSASTSAPASEPGAGPGPDKDLTPLRL